MKKIEFNISINAPRQRVWDTIIGAETYPMWTSAFAAGSQVETDWKKGSEAFFTDGSAGMYSEIMESIAAEYLSIRNLGDVKDGKKVIENGKVSEWHGAMENYTLKTIDGKTEWTVQMDVVPAYEDYFLKVWPKAMQIVKDLAERN